MLPEFTSLTLENTAFQVRFLEHLQKAQPRTSGLGGAEPWSLLTQAPPWGGRGMVGASFWGLSREVAHPSLERGRQEALGPTGGGCTPWPCPKST